MQMDKYLFIAGYCLVSIATAAVVLRLFKGFVGYSLISASIPPFVLTAADALYRGYIDSWSYPAFVIAWFISFGCAVLYFFAKRAFDRRKQAVSKPESQ